MNEKRDILVKVAYKHLLEYDGLVALAAEELSLNELTAGFFLWIIIVYKPFSDFLRAWLITIKKEVRLSVGMVFTTL